MITTNSHASFRGIGHPLRAAGRVSATVNRSRHTTRRFAFRITILGESSDPVSIRLPDAPTHFMMRRTLCIMRGASREFRHRHSEKLQQAFPERAQRPTFQECLSASAVSESRFATWAALEADSKSSTYEDEVILWMNEPERMVRLRRQDRERQNGDESEYHSPDIRSTSTNGAAQRPDRPASAAPSRASDRRNFPC